MDDPYDLPIVDPQPETLGEMRDRQRRLLQNIPASEPGGAWTNIPTSGLDPVEAEFHVRKLADDLLSEAVWRTSSSSTSRRPHHGRYASRSAAPATRT